MNSASSWFIFNSRVTYHWWATSSTCLWIWLQKNSRLSGISLRKLYWNPLWLGSNIFYIFLTLVNSRSTNNLAEYSFLICQSLFKIDSQKHSHNYYFQSQLIIQSLILISSAFRWSVLLFTWEIHFLHNKQSLFAYCNNLWFIFSIFLYSSFTLRHFMSWAFSFFSEVLIQEIEDDRKYLRFSSFFQ